MRPIVLIVLLLAAPFLAVAQGTAPATAPFKKDVDFRTVGSSVPPFRLVGLDGTAWTNDSLYNGHNFFVMLFNPGCDHCKEMTKALQRNRSLFAENRVMMVTGDMMRKELEYFSKELEMEKYPELHVGLDSSGIINSTFLYNSIPQVNVYSPKGTLLKSFSGLTSVAPLRQYLWINKKKRR